jgi:acyl-CoA dehydrogenase
MGMEITSDAMQIFGGYGYTKDQGIEQLYRDNRITPIYEGTNSVQAIDLVFRKIINKNGNIIGNYTQLIEKGIDESAKNNETKLFAENLSQYLKVLIDFTAWIEKRMKNSKNDVSAACNDYLKVLGLVAVGYSWLKVLDISYREIKNNKNFFEDKIETAKFFFDRILPRIDSYYKSGTAGSKNIMNFNFN